MKAVCGILFANIAKSKPGLQGPKVTTFAYRWAHGRDGEVRVQSKIRPGEWVVVNGRCSTRSHYCEYRPGQREDHCGHGDGFSCGGAGTARSDVAVS